MDTTRVVEDIRRRLEHGSIAAVAVTDPVNVAYVTGFEGVFDAERAHVVLVSPEQCILFTDTRYGAAADAAAHDSVWDVRVVRDSLWASVADALPADASLAVEDTMSHREYLDISARFGQALTVIHGWVEDLRLVKRADEIRRIEAAQQLTDAGFDHLLGFIRPGLTEAEVALELEFFLRRSGSEGVAFPPIVASGPNSAHPHATVTSRVLCPGDLLKLDFGARVDSYCADMTRTVVLGGAAEWQREVYGVVLAANQAGIDAVAPGLAGKTIDSAARAVIDRAGYGSQFGHGLGHGVGRAVHELPGVGPRSVGPVPQGAVITIEPGVYLEGRGGVRIEDLVVVEADGARVLTRSPKSLIEL